MISYAITYAKRCHACQVHDDFIHQAPGYLRSTTSTWPFEMWGMDVVGPISPPSSEGHRFILAITNYFFKWAEPIPSKEVEYLTWSNSLNITSFTALVYHDGSLMIMGPSLSAGLFRGFAISSGCRACLQRHIIQPLTPCRSFQQNYWKTSQEIHLEKPTWLGRQIRLMLMGLSYDGSNPSESYTILFGIWVRSYTPTRNWDSISSRYLDGKDDKWWEASTVTLKTRGFGW